MNKLISATIFLLLFLTTTPLWCQEDWKVLLINSYSYDQSWSNEITEAVKEAFDEEEIQLLVEFLDTKRYNSPDYYQCLEQLFYTKYNKARMDLIITSDDNATNFVLKHRDALFRDIPLVFCGVNDIALPERDNFTNMTGSLEVPDFTATIDLALKLQPKLDTVYLVNESITTGKSDRELIEKILNKYDGRLTCHWLEDLSDEKLCTALQEMSETSFVLLLSCFPNKECNVFSMSDGADFVSRYSSQPVYSMWTYFLGHGIVGGRLTSAHYQGVTAAQMALEILKGRAPESIPVSTDTANHDMFDYNQLIKFNIDVRKLPENSVIINKPKQSVLEIYFWEIITVSSIILLLVIICFLLLGNIHYRRKTEKNLSLSLREKNTLLSELYHRTKNNMQVISSFLFLESSVAGSDETVIALKEAANRIETMSLVHQMLYQSQNLARISLLEYSTNLIAQIRRSYYVPDKEIAVFLNIQDTEIVIDIAIPLGLIINELLSNVYKHAFPEKSGKVTLTMQRVTNIMIELTIHDNGVGFPDDYDNCSTLGLSIVQNLVTHQLSGQLKRTNHNGTYYSITFQNSIHENRI